MKIFKLPDLGEGLQEAEIVKWHVKVGDEVKADQAMVSVETAKAVVDIPAPYPGKIARLYGNAGDIAHIGAPLVGFEGASDARDTGTVVGTVEVGQKVMPDAPAAPAPAAGGINTGYTLTATLNGGYSDTDCGNLTLTSTGVKGKSGSADLSRCW